MKLFSSLLLILLVSISFTSLVSAPSSEPLPEDTEISFTGWVWNGITGFWDYLFKGEVIDSKTVKPISYTQEVITAVETGEYEVIITGEEEIWVEDVIINESTKEATIIPKKNPTVQTCVKYDTKIKDLCLEYKETAYTIPTSLPVKQVSSLLTATPTKTITSTTDTKGETSFVVSLKDYTGEVKIGTSSILLVPIVVSTGILNNTITKVSISTPSNYLNITSSTSPYNKLVGYYNFDINTTSNSGNIFAPTTYDLSKVGANLNNLEGYIGQGYRFNESQVGGYLRTPTAGFGTEASWTNATISLWANRQGNNTIAGDYLFSRDFSRPSLSTNPSGVITFNTQSTALLTYPTTTAGWHLYTVTWGYNGTHSNYTLYFDGLPVNSSIILGSETVRTSDMWRFGQSGTGSTLNSIGSAGIFNGTIDELMFFNTNISSTQVLAIYNNQSERFEKTGTYKVSSNLLTRTNEINVSYNINYNFPNTNTSLLLEFYNATGWFALPEQNITSLTNYSFLTPNAEIINLTYTHYSDAYKFYTPQLVSPINLYYDVDPTQVINCGSFTEPNTYYKLIRDINTTASCFGISASNITFDGQEHIIRGDNIGVDWGMQIVTSTVLNSTIKNVTFRNFGQSGSGGGIQLFQVTNVSIQDVNLTSNYDGIKFTQSTFIDMNRINSISNTNYGFYLSASSNNNQLSNLTANSNAQNGIYLMSSSNNIFNNTNMWNCSQNSSYACVYLIGTSTHSQLNIFNNLYINYSIGTGIWLNSGPTVGETSHNTFRDIILENVAGDNVKVSHVGASVLNNTFLNATYNNSREVVSGDDTQIIRKWYYTAYVNDTLGANVSNANITAYNSTGAYQFNLTTGNDGLTTSRGEITDYVNTAGTKTYYSPYNNTASSSSTTPPYANLSQSWDLTTQHNNRQDFTLIKTNFPSVIWNSQTPADLNLSNFIGPNGVNITYNISDYLNFLNVSSIFLHYKANSTVNNIMYYQNGTAHEGFFTTNYSSNVTPTFTFNLKDNQVLPATYNYGEFTMEHTVHTANALSQNNDYLSIELLNVSNTKHSFFEVMANSTNIMRYYYCNSSYAFSNSPVTNSNCNLIYTVPSSNPYDHTHTIYSSHQVIPFTIDEATGKFGTIKVTPTSYFILRGAGTTRFFSITNTSRANAIKTSSNSGNSWTSQTYTVDAHLHQFNTNTSLWYYACANDTLNNQNCSSLVQDQIGLVGFPPTSPQVYSPIADGYSGVIPINYTASTPYSPNVISFYNISLMSSSLVEISHIVNNNLNLGYSWDTSLIANGNYIIRVTACDDTSQCAIGYSELFTLSHFKQDELYILPEEKSFYTAVPANVTVRCRLSNGSDCPPQTDCRITSYYPNKTILGDNLFMTNSDPLWNYNFGLLDTIGSYNSIVFCYNHLNGTASFNFDVLSLNPSSTPRTQWGYCNDKLPNMEVEC